MHHRFGQRFAVEILLVASLLIEFANNLRAGIFFERFAGEGVVVGHLNHTAHGAKHIVVHARLLAARAQKHLVARFFVAFAARSYPNSRHTDGVGKYRLLERTQLLACRQILGAHAHAEPYGKV